jgi:hypothetical protein
MEEERAPERDQQAYTNMTIASLTIASLLNAHIATINSERQALWLRFTAMLLANALLYGFSLQLQAPTTLHACFVAGFGWALCMAWLVLTISSFRLFSLQIDAASRFARPQLEGIDEYANPVNVVWHTSPMIIGIQRRVARRPHWQFRAMVFVIVLFMLAYAFWLTHHIYYIFVFVEGPR